MSSLLQTGAREELRRRLDGLRPETPARWGKFTAPQMVAHAIQSIGMMTGDLHVASKPVPWLVSHAPLKHLLIYVIPFPKGLPTAPELLARPCVDGVSAQGWTDECTAFEAALLRIPAVEKDAAWPPHPALGTLTGSQWGTLQYRHLDHHFRQFGI